MTPAVKVMKHRFLTTGNCKDRRQRTEYRIQRTEIVIFHVMASGAWPSRNRDEVRTFGALRHEVVRYAHFEVIKMQEPDARQNTEYRKQKTGAKN